MLPVVVALAQNGFTAVAVYLRGYAPSAPAPDGRYDLGTLGRDIPHIVHSLGFTRTHLVAHDWGAAIAYSAAIQAPSCIASLVAMAVPPLPAFLAGLTSPAQLRRSSYMARLQLPEALGGGTRWLTADNFATIDRLWSRWSPGWTPPSETIRAVKHTFRQPGTAAAAVAYYRHMLPGSLPLDEYVRTLTMLTTRPIRSPSLLMTGERDGCIGSELFSPTQTTFTGECEVVRLAKAGHFLHLEQPVVVHQKILEFLGRV